MNYMKEFSKHIGASFITLIVKWAGAENIKDYWPISLIGAVYKVLARVLATRLQKVLPKVISSTQGAFVHGCQILDSVLIANDCIHSRNKARRPGLICKIDMEKAYDRVNWKFLLYLLGRMGFGIKWRTWILECLKSNSLPILINESPKGFFFATRGLR